MKSIISTAFFCALTVPALAACKIYGQLVTSGCLKNIYCRSSRLSFSKKHLESPQPRGYLQQFSFIFQIVFMLFPASAYCEQYDWSMGVYAGQYYDSEPAGFTHGNAAYLDQYIVAVTASKTVWRSEALPLSLEIDGMIGHQYGLATLQEIAIAPVLRWSSFPWNKILQTDFRFGPLGVSYTTAISPLERGTNGDGNNTLNFLLAELAFSLPQIKSEEIFLRLHHRCAMYDVINNYGANGEDFFALGYRHFF